MPLQRVSESGKLPCSEMPGEKDDAFTASIGALEVFKSVIDDNARDIFARVAREEADLRQLASERNKLSAQQTAALSDRHFRERKSKIAQANVAQAPINRIYG